MKNFTLFLLLLFIASCAGSPIRSVMSTFPSKDDVKQMKIGETYKSEILEKYSGHIESIINDMACFFYAGHSIGRGSTSLCFGANGKLKTKTYME